MRVLLTGITGFVGSHLAERLLADGHEVHGIAFEPPPHPNLAAVAARVRIHRADLSDADGLRATHVGDRVVADHERLAWPDGRELESPIEHRAMWLPPAHVV